MLSRGGAALVFVFLHFVRAQRHMLQSKCICTRVCVYVLSAYVYTYVCVRVCAAFVCCMRVSVHFCVLCNYAGCALMRRISAEFDLSLG